MNNRISHQRVTLHGAFTLNGDVRTFPPGTYDVEVTEQLLEGLSFVAYRRISTTIALPAASQSHHSKQIIPIDPEELAFLLARDAREIPAQLH